MSLGFSNRRRILNKAAHVLSDETVTWILYLALAAVATLAAAAAIKRFA